MLIPEPKAARLETLMSESKASKFNAHTLKELQAAIEENPEVDLTTKMPMNTLLAWPDFKKNPIIKPRKLPVSQTRDRDHAKLMGIFLRRETRNHQKI